MNFKILWYQNKYPNKLQFPKSEEVNHTYTSLYREVFSKY